MKQLLKNISPFNNRDAMPTILFIVKKVLAFFLCYIVGSFVAEGAVILLHFAAGKNVFAGEMFDIQTITLIKYYGFSIMTGVALLYWKIIEKKPLIKMGITKAFSSYFIGILMGTVLLAVSALFNIQSTGDTIWNGGAYGIEASIITAAVLLITTICLAVACDCRSRCKIAGGKR